MSRRWYVVLPSRCRLTERILHGHVVRTSRTNPRRTTSNTEWLRGMSEVGRALGASATLSDVRTRRLLRQLAEQARDEAFPCDPAPHHQELRARRGLGLVL